MDIPANINKEQLKTIGLDKPEFSFKFFGLSEESKTTIIQLNNDINSYISLLPIEIINNVLFQHSYGYHILSKKPDILKKELDTIFNDDNSIILIVAKNCTFTYGKILHKKLPIYQCKYCAIRLYINPNGPGFIHAILYSRDLVYNINDINIYEINYIKND